MTDLISSRMEQMRESVTLALNAKAKALSASGRKIYNLTAGELATSTPENIQDAVGKTLAQNKYTPVAGLPELRKLIAEHYSTLTGKSIDVSNVVVTSGAKPAEYAVFMSIINPGDEVIIPSPYWGSYKPMIELAGGKVVSVPTDNNFQIQPKIIADAITKKTKAILINSPNNPTGATYNKSNLIKLAKLANDNKIIVVSDEIYHTLIYETDYVLPSSLPFDTLIIINGFSKSQALTGWRIGYLIADNPIASASTNILSHINGNAPLPSQYAGIEAMKNNDKPPGSTLQTLKNQRQIVIENLMPNNFIDVVEPAGAFYFFIDIRKITQDSARWCEKLLDEQGVALVPGEAFDAPGFVRLTFVCDQNTLVEALDKINQFANDQEV